MQSLHRLKFSWGYNRSLELEWPEGAPGDPVHIQTLPGLVEADSEAAPDPVGRLGIPAIVWRPEADWLFEPLQLREETDYLVDVTLPISRVNAAAEWEKRSSWPLGERFEKYFRADPPRRWHFVEGGVRITGVLNFRAHVGVANLQIPGGPPLLVEVTPAKIGYFEDLKALLELISAELLELLFQLDEPTSIHLGLSSAQATEPLALLFHLRRALSEPQLPTAVEAVLNRPHSSVYTEQRSVPLGTSRYPAPDDAASEFSKLSFRSGGPAASLFRGYTPELLPERRTGETKDTRENRYVKSFLEDLFQIIDDLQRRLKDGGNDLSAREAVQWRERIADWLSDPVWREVGPLTYFPSNSQVLQRREGYKDVLQIDLALQLGLRLPWERGLEIADGLDGDVRPISELYQYWCYFLLRSILRRICTREEVSASSVFRRTGDGLHVELREGKQSKTVFRYEAGSSLPARISLFHNRSFRRQTAGNTQWDNSYSASFEPDYSILIEIVTDGVTRFHWLHFDAKYRLDFGRWEAAVNAQPAEVEQRLTRDRVGEELDGRPAYKKDDLYKMHSYRDALLGSRGSYVLFPGTGRSEEVFVRFPGAAYRSSPNWIPSVGAFQLRPHQEEGQSRVLERFLREIIGQLTVRRTYQEETGLF